MAQPLNGRALAAIAIGSVFIWSGAKGWSILGTAGDLILGTKPDQPVVNKLTTDAALPPGVLSDIPGGANAGGLVGLAMSYQGHAYRFGGAPGVNGTNPWDCSSFVNYCVGAKLQRPIPGLAPGKYNGSFHGPPTGVWAAWSGMKRITRAEVGPGDILVWLGHMGIAIGNGQMISALNPAEGTKVTPIDGFGNGPLITMGRL
jgi:hypothetical protein